MNRDYQHDNTGWHYDQPAGEAYADAPYVEDANVYEAHEQSDAYEAHEVYDEAHEVYDEAPAPSEVSLVSPWLIGQLTATPMMVDGMPAVEVMMSLVRAYDRAAEVCPYEGYDILGWHNDVSVAMRANRHGRWTTYVASVGSFQPHPVGDGAAVSLGHDEFAAAWRFMPEVLGQFDMWAFVSVNGVYVPFDEMVASSNYIDTNGAAKLCVLL